MGEHRRIRLTVVLGPADTESVTLFRWLLRWLIELHAGSPVPLRIRLEVLEPGDEGL